jgi:hypothetical protein
MSALAEPLVYRPLRQGYIRLIELCAGSGDDHLYCKIRTYPRTSPPPYEALSYIWGPQDYLYDLYCGDRPLQVLKIGRNLRDAFLRLRPNPNTTKLPRVLWVDKVCINQENITERSVHVRIMGSVFRESRKVWVWLGEEDKATQNAFRLAAYIYDKKISCEDGVSFDTWQALKTFSKDSAMSHSDIAKVVTDIHQLTDRPWFCRAWVFQEIVLVAMADLVCGAHIMSFECFTWFCNNWFHAISGKLVSREAKIMLATRDVMSETADGRLPTDYFEHLLNYRRQCIASDPHDVIFSLLGLFPEQSTAIIRPDYSLSIKDTFTTATRFTIRESSELRILCAVECPKYEDQDGFPSWVPDWRAPMESCLNTLGDRTPRSDWWATKGSPLLLSIHETENELGV